MAKTMDMAPSNVSLARATERIWLGFVPTEAGAGYELRAQVAVHIDI